MQVQAVSESNQSTNSLLILVDGSSYLFRAFHALPSLTNAQGEPTGAIYGVVAMLRKLIQDYHPAYCAIIFDPPGKTFREELYPEYKANRAIMPDELRVQIQPLFEIIRAMGLPLIVVDGMEADDVIGTLACQATISGLKTLISTSDKDMTQLVNQHVTLVNTMTNTHLDPLTVIDKFGVAPEQIIDYLSLVGDSIDNIPGVPQVGPKTAVKWLQKYGSLEQLVEHANEITGKVGENLRNSLSRLPLIRELVTIKLDVSLPVKIEDLNLLAPDNKKLIDLFKHLGFKTWLASLNSEARQEPNKLSISKAYQTILTKHEFELFLQKLLKAQLIAVDTETTGLNPLLAELVGISFSTQVGEAVYIPVAHDYEGAPPQLSREYVLSELKPLLEDSRYKKTGHNLKYDMEIFLNYGINLRGITFDSMLESYVFNSTASRHDMDSLAFAYLGYKTVTFEEVAGKGVKQKTFNQISLETAGFYAAEDADISLQLHQTLWQKICDDQKLAYILQEIEIPLIKVLAKMERQGVLIDIELLKQQGQEINQRLAVLEQETYQLAGQVFNLSSPKQLQEILFFKLGLPIIEKTPTGQASTAENVLQELAHQFELPKIILEHRSLSKLKSTYVDRLPEQINSITRRVHTCYHQAVAATGRLSSTDPNLQNIPIRTEEGRRIRQAFIAPPGYKILALDYSQIELRIMAHLSGDERLLSAFQENLDIHCATAAEVFGVPLAEVSNEQRRSAKAINFGLIYGMSAFGLARQLGIDRGAAQAYVNLYFARYTGVKRYMDETRVLAKKQGFVETLYGRRLYLPEINSRNKQRQQAAERTAINAPMQGTAADIIKLAMIRIADWLNKNHVDVKMLMQVHDELVFEVAIKDIDYAVNELKKLMTHSDRLQVPLMVESGVGKNWDEAH